MFIERLWRSLKYEDIYLKGYVDGREARTGISLWMAFYNGRRPHQALGNRTPMRSGARVLRAWLVAVLIECIVPISQEDVAVILEVRDDQIVLRCEVPIKVYLRDTSLFDNLLYADGVDTLAIE